MEQDVWEKPDWTVDIDEENEGWILGITAVADGFVILQPMYGFGVTDPMESKEWKFAAFIPHRMAKRLGELEKEKE